MLLVIRHDQGHQHCQNAATLYDQETDKYSHQSNILHHAVEKGIGIAQS